MLDGAGNAEREVQLRCNHLPGLTDLPVIRGKTHIHCRTGGAHCGTDRIGKAFKRLETRLIKETCATGNNTAGTHKFRTVTPGFLEADKARTFIHGGTDELFNLSVTVHRRRLKGRGANGGYNHGLAHFNRRQKAAGINTAHKGTGAFNSENIRNR